MKDVLKNIDNDIYFSRKIINTTSLHIKLGESISKSIDEYIYHMGHSYICGCVYKVRLSLDFYNLNTIGNKIKNNFIKEVI